MGISAATPQSTFDHMLGSGAFQWSWWVEVKVTGTKPNGYDATDDWTAEITAEDGNGGTVTKTIDHKTIMQAARAVLAQPPEQVGALLQRECSHLLFEADAADFDAPLADSLLQFMVLGEIVYA